MSLWLQREDKERGIKGKNLLCFSVVCNSWAEFADLPNWQAQRTWTQTVWGVSKHTFDVNKAEKETAMGIIRHYGAFILALCRFIMDAWFWLEARNQGCTVWCWEQLHPTLLMRFIINLISQNQNAAKPSLRFGIDWTDSTLCLTDAACIKKRPHH